MRKLTISILISLLFAINILFPFASLSIAKTNSNPLSKITTSNTATKQSQDDIFNDPTIDKWQPTKIIKNITDPKSILGSSKTIVEDAISDAYQKSGENIFIILIPRFDGAINGDDWCNKVAIKSGFSNQSVIFAVAYDSGEQTVFIPKDSPNLNYNKISTIADLAQEALVQGDWAGASETVINAVVSLTDKPYYISYIVYTILILILIFFIAAISYKIFFTSRGKNRKSTVSSFFDITKKEIQKITHHKVFDPTQTSTSLTAVKMEENKELRELENSKTNNPIVSTEVQNVETNVPNHIKTPNTSSTQDTPKLTGRGRRRSR